MKTYTLGFIFNRSLDQVLLMHKSKPDWQAGKLNGVGGKIEEDEDALTCIAREIHEETGLSIPKEQLLFMGRLNASTWTMDVFCHVYPGDMTDARSLEQEPIEWFPVLELPANTLTNLHWMIPFALEKLQANELKHFTIELV